MRQVEEQMWGEEVETSSTGNFLQKLGYESNKREDGNSRY